jgi:hypothetical protein
MSLAEQMVAIAAEQRLTSFAIHYYNHAGIPPYFYCYVHDNGVVGTGGQEGDTPAEAIARACADLNAKRFPLADVPELEAA